MKLIPEINFINLNLRNLQICELMIFNGVKIEEKVTNLCRKKETLLEPRHMKAARG